MKPRFSWLLVMALLNTSACAGLPGMRGDQPASTHVAGTTAPAVSPTPAGAAVTQGIPTPFSENEVFANQLARLIEQRDFAGLRSAMGDRFSLAHWRGEGSELSPDEAIESLRHTYLVEGSKPQADFTVNPASLLGGADPMGLFGPDSNAVQAFIVRGLGQQATDEAILIVSRSPETGGYYWRGMLVSSQGFPVGTTPQPGDEQFYQGLVQALEGRDFESLRAMMAEQFAFAAWNSESSEVSAEEAIQQLQERFLAEGSNPAVRFEMDVTTLLNGADPLSIWDPAVDPVRAMHIMGLGPQANEEALVVVAREAGTGRLYWHGLLFPPGGSFQSTTGGSGTPAATDVQYVLAKENLNLRTGPGESYPVAGILEAGQIAKVIGKSADGGWWQVVCEGTASGSCWISADPELSEPTTAP